MTTLVTGATGFVGSAVARKLLARGETVRVLTRPGADRRNIEGLDVEIAEGDLMDPASLAEAVAGVASLYHVAADYRLWVKDPSVLYRANRDGSLALFQAAKAAGVTRAVYTSSVAVLGNTGTGAPADEETPVSVDDMIGHYKRSKFVAEEAVRRFAQEAAFPVVIVNPSTPVGPRDIKPTPTGRMVHEAATGKMPAYVDTGLNIVHVDDVAEGHLLAHDKGTPGERYVLGGEDLSLAEILGIIADLTGRPAPKVALPRKAIYPIAYAAEGWARLTGGAEPFVTVDALKMAAKKMYFSSAKAERDLGYTHRPAREALRDAVEGFGIATRGEPAGAAA